MGIQRYKIHFDTMEFTVAAREVADGAWCAHADVAALEAEVERLTKCLAVANAQAEKFEREWYLRGDEVEAMIRERDEMLADWKEEAEGKVATIIALEDRATRLRAELDEIRSRCPHHSWDGTGNKDEFKCCYCGLLRVYARHQAQGEGNPSESPNGSAEESGGK